MSLIDFLIENQKIISEEYYRNNTKPIKTWEALQTKLPKLKQTMRFNTFKQYLSVFIPLSERIQKQDEKELTKLREKDAELAILRSKVKAMEKKLSRLGRNSRNIEGWTVRLTTKGYYNLCKSFGGKVETIYIGKVLDEGEARKRIAERMTKLRQRGVMTS